VINFQCPEDEKTYLHRTGRTGRAGNKGTAVTFVDWDDVPRWRLIDKALELGVPEPVETYSSSEHLYADLDIPQGTKGRLPRAQRTHAGLDAEVLEDLGEPGGRKGGPRGESRGRSRDRSEPRSGDGRRGGRGERAPRDGTRREDAPRKDTPREEAAREDTPREETREQPRAQRERAPRETSVEKSEDGTTRRRRRRRGGRGTGEARPAQSGPAAE